MLVRRHYEPVRRLLESMVKERVRALDGALSPPQPASLLAFAMRVAVWQLSPWAKFHHPVELEVAGDRGL